MAKKRGRHTLRDELEAPLKRAARQKERIRRAIGYELDLVAEWYHRMVFARSGLAGAVGRLHAVNNEKCKFSLLRLADLAGIPQDAMRECAWLSEMGVSNAASASSATVLEAGKMSQVYPQRRWQILQTVKYNPLLTPTQVREIVKVLLKTPLEDISDNRKGRMALRTLATTAPKRMPGRKKKPRR